MKTIVLADDEEDLRTIIRMTLEDPGYRILEAADGNAALKLVLSDHPDLLILDWMMPEMSGIEVIQTLREDHQFHTTPIILLTAKDRFSDRAQGAALGVFAYLVKPFSPLELLDMVREALGEKGASLQGSR